MAPECGETDLILRCGFGVFSEETRKEIDLIKVS
jgi:hypothetical protein